MTKERNRPDALARHLRHRSFREQRLAACHDKEDGHESRPYSQEKQGGGQDNRYSGFVCGIVPETGGLLWMFGVFSHILAVASLHGAMIRFRNY